jgi:Ca2+-binding RTX toxin-like protein
MRHASQRTSRGGVLAEHLENRAYRTVGISYDPSTHVLTITGSGNGDAVDVSYNSSTQNLDVNDGYSIRSYLEAVVWRINAEMGGGDDYLSVTHDFTGISDLNGGSGADTILGGGGKNYLFGGTEGDTLTGGPDEDLIDGDGGTDTLCGAGGKDNIHGGADNDTIYGGSGTGNELYGEPGNDLLFCEGIYDVAHGGSGEDGLSSNTGNAFMYGDEGNDYFYSFNDQTDAIDGGDDDDMMVEFDEIDALLCNNVEHVGPSN